MRPKRGYGICQWLSPASISFSVKQPGTGYSSRPMDNHLSDLNLKMFPGSEWWGIGNSNHRYSLISLTLPRPRDRFCMSPKANSMKDRDRNPALSLSYALPGKQEFCVCRVAVGCALTTIESFDKLPIAKRFMRRIAAQVPGSYVVFSQTSRRVLGKVARRAD